MGTLKIGDKSVTIGDDFFKLSPEQQHGTVDEIAKSLNVSAPEVKSDTNKLSQPDIPLSSVPLQAAKNLPGSALRFGGDIAHAVMHPVETVKNIGRLGAGGLEKGAEYLAGSQQQGPHEKYFDAAWQGLTDRYGGYENIKRTVANDPVGVLADLSSVFGGGEAALARVPGLARTAEGLGKLSTVTNPLTGVSKAAEKAVEYGGPAVAGLMTGKGMAPFKTAIESARSPAKAAEFRQEMRNPQGEKIVKQVRDAVEKMRFAKSTAYQRDMAAIKGRPEVLDFNHVWNDFENATRQYSFGDQQRRTMHPSIVPVHQELKGILTKWSSLPKDTFHTAAGFDELKKHIGHTLDNQPFNSAPRKYAGQVYNSVKDTITRLDPKYAEIMKNYEQASDLLREVEKTLGAGKKTTEDTALRKILSSTRSNVNTNFGRREKLIEELAKHDPKLRAAIGGHVLNPILPGGLAQIPAIGEAAAAMMMGNPKFAAPLVASSPRVMGEAMHGFGWFQKYLKQHPELARKLLQSALAARGGGAVPRIDVYRRPETTE